MSAGAKGKKRKSGDNIGQPAKKAKTGAAPAKPAKPAPKRVTADTTAVTGTPRDKKRKAAAKATKVVEDVNRPEPVVSAADDEADSGAELTAAHTAELTAAHTADLLAGFSSDESGDEDGDDGIDVAAVTAAPRTREVCQAMVQAAAAATPTRDDPESSPGVVYISRLPHGFFEKQLRAYFSQFGAITHLRLARNRKTGKSKHFAFIEFAAAAVADIVARTMDKYLLFGHVLQCTRIPADQVRAEMWKGPRCANGKVRPRNRIQGTRLRIGTDRDGWEQRVAREQQRRQRKHHTLAQIGYAFDMPPVKSVHAVPRPPQRESADPAAAAAAAATVPPEHAEAEPLVDKPAVARVTSAPRAKAIVDGETTNRGPSAGEKGASKKRKTKA